MGAFSQAGGFLIDTIGGLYLTIVTLRLLLPLVKADFYNPLSQFVVRATQYPLAPLRKLLPTLGRFDLAAFTLAIIVQVAIIQLLVIISGQSLPILTTLIWGVIGLVSLTIWIYIIGMVAVIIISFVAPYSNNPAVGFIRQLIEPVLAPFRKIIPPIGGLDFSVMIALIGLQVGRILLAGLAASFQLTQNLYDFVPGI